MGTCASACATPGMIGSSLPVARAPSPVPGCHPADGREQLLSRNVKRFRGGLVFKAHRLLYHSTLGLKVIKKKKKDGRRERGEERGEERRGLVWFAPRQRSAEVSLTNASRLRCAESCFGRQGTDSQGMGAAAELRARRKIMAGVSITSAHQIQRKRSLGVSCPRQGGNTSTSPHSATRREKKDSHHLLKTDPGFSSANSSKRAPTGREGTHPRRAQASGIQRWSRPAEAQSALPPHPLPRPYTPPAHTPDPCARAQPG